MRSDSTNTMKPLTQAENAWVANLPSWMDRAGIAQGLRQVTDKAGYRAWIERIRDAREAKTKQV